jgi:hypothetical protein
MSFAIPPERYADFPRFSTRGDPQAVPARCGHITEARPVGVLRDLIVRSPPGILPECGQAWLSLVVELLMSRTFVGSQPNI